MTARKTVLIAILVLLLLVSIALAAILFWTAQHAPVMPIQDSRFGPVEVQDRTTLEGNTQTVIPASASGLHGIVNGSQQSITTHMRFEIPPSDLDKFMQSTGCTTPLVSADIRSQLQTYPQRDWWMPQKAQKYASCNAVTEKVIQLVFVDLTNPASDIVYVIASTK